MWCSIWLCHKPLAWVPVLVCLDYLMCSLHRDGLVRVCQVGSFISLGSCTHYGNLVLCCLIFIQFFPKKRKYHYNIKNKYLYFTPQNSLNTCQEFTVWGYRGEITLSLCSIPRIFHPPHQWQTERFPAFLFPFCTIFLSFPFLARMHTTYENYPPRSPGKFSTHQAREIVLLEDCWIPGTHCLT